VVRRHFLWHAGSVLILLAAIVPARAVLGGEGSGKATPPDTTQARAASDDEAEDEVVRTST
jgi:hypothetical protein